MKTFFSHSRIALLLLAGMVLPLLAQNTDTQIRNQELQRRTQLGLRDNLPSVETDEEFGEILTLKPAKRWSITPFISARGYWTSNVLLANKGENGDSVWVQTEGVNSSYKLTKEWQIFAGYNYSLTRYSENPQLDTDAQNTDFGTTYKLPFAQDLRVGTGIRGLWMTSPHQQVEVYRESSPYLNLVNSHYFLDNRLAWFYGYEFDKKFTHPVGFDRTEHSLFTGVGYEWLPSLSSQAVLRQNWQFYDFRPTPAQANTQIQGRQEHVSTVSLETVWQPLSWLQIAAFSSLTYDNSVNSTRDYKLANLGGEIRGFYKFDLGPNAVSDDKPKKSKFSQENISLREPVNRTLEVRAGPRFGQVFGSMKLGQTGTEFDFRDDLNLDSNFVSGSQIDVDWQPIPKFHAGFQYTYDRFEQRSTTTQVISRGGKRFPLSSGSVVDGTAELNTVAATFGYDVYKDKTWVVTPYIGAKAAFLSEELFLIDTVRGFTLSGNGSQEVYYATPILGAGIKAFMSRSWYFGIDCSAFGMDQWNYVHGQAFTGYDFSENWGMRFGYDLNYGSYANTSKSFTVDGGLGSIYLQAVYGF